MPAPHGGYLAQRVRDIRRSMALSQPVFAAALNVSTETVRAWEQGKREPDGPTRRLLEVAEQQPGVLLAKIRMVDRDLEEAMEIYAEGARKYRNALRELAK